MQAAVVPAIWMILYKVAIGLTVAGVGALMLYPIKKVKEEWAKLHAKLDAAQNELVQQRENHLTHIQASSEAQVKLLEKVSETLSGVRLDLKEQTGFIQAMSMSPRRARAAAKK